MLRMVACVCFPPFTEETTRSTHDTKVDEDDELEAFVAKTSFVRLLCPYEKDNPVQFGDRLEGDFNVLFHLRFYDGTTWLARFPLSYSPATRTRNKVVTMKYAKERTGIQGKVIV